MRTAMFGGSFNPIHNGHIDIAAEVREKYGLDRVLFMVANDPPHKKIADGVKADVRYEMTRLALENHGDLEPCDLELKRQGKSYTVDTLEILHEMYPDDRIFCIVGADMLLSIDTWHNAPELLKRAEFIAVGRPDSGGEAAMNEKVKALEADYGAKVYISGIVGPDISSTAIRERVEDWRPITDLVPLKVAEYIYQNGLYFPEDTEKIRQRLKADLKPTRYAAHHAAIQALIRLAAYILHAVVDPSLFYFIRKVHYLVKCRHVALAGSMAAYSGKYIIIRNAEYPPCPHRAERAVYYRLRHV